MHWLGFHHALWLLLCLLLLCRFKSTFSVVFCFVEVFSVLYHCKSTATTSSSEMQASVGLSCG